MAALNSVPPEQNKHKKVQEQGEKNVKPKQNKKGEEGERKGKEKKEHSANQGFQHHKLFALVLILLAVLGHRYIWTSIMFRIFQTNIFLIAYIR